MISDPLTLEIGETRESALQAGLENGPFSGSAYAFNGEGRRGSKINNWGANLDVQHEVDGAAISAGAGYLSDLGDSDVIQDGISSKFGGTITRRRVESWTLNAQAEVGDFVVIGEYLAATERFNNNAVVFDGKGAKPRAWNAEVGYSFDLMGKGSTVAVAYQGTREALELELPKRRWLAGISVDILENTALSFEWAHDKDYSSSDGGTGENANTVTTQLAVEFP